MLSALRNRYVIFYLLIYLASLLILHIEFHLPWMDLLPVFLRFGVAFSTMAWLLVKDWSGVADKSTFKYESLFIVALILYFIFYVTYGTTLINKLLPASILDIAWQTDLVVLLKKLVVFVIIPFGLYKLFGFSLADFGLRQTARQIFNRKAVLIFIVLSVAVLLFQYFFSSGAKPVRDGQFSAAQLLKGWPLLFIWLLIEVGLVEEFFFRALLQSRITVILKSPFAGIIISGLIFGLAHAPGLYLRGAESEGINESFPFYFWAAYTICAMSVAGIFLGIVWNRTRNLYLVMAIHAMVDLLPNTADFFHNWKV
jgi:membrane protease YdiL (CAAX protease family)